jgi:hypothetical protein
MRVLGYLKACITCKNGQLIKSFGLKVPRKWSVSGKACHFIQGWTHENILRLKNTWNYLVICIGQDHIKIVQGPYLYWFTDFFEFI